MIAADLDLTLLPTFLAFAETLSFTRAAEVVHLSQPAVHLHVSRLADSLGLALYRRVGRALVLTDAGKELAAFARDIADKKAAFLAGQGADDTPVVLAAGAGAYLYLLGPGIQRFRAEATVPLRLLTRDRTGTIEAVRSGEAHLGVTTLDELPHGLEATPLVEVAQVLAIPEHHAFATRRTVKLADLDGEHLVVPPPDRPQRAALASALRGIDWHVSVEALGWDLVLQFVSLGLGLAVVNGCCRIPEGVVTKPLRELPRVAYYLVARPLLTPAAEQLQTALRVA